MSRLHLSIVRVSDLLLPVSQERPEILPVLLTRLILIVVIDSTLIELPHVHRRLVL
jgi:hypothetical protein